MNILIIRPGALGDTLMLLPCLRALSQTHRIVVAGRRPGIDFLGHYVHTCFDIDRSPWYRLFLARPAAEGLPGNPSDRVICFLADPDGTIQNNLETYYPQAKTFLFPSLPAPHQGMHVAEYVCQCLVKARVALNPKKVLHDATEIPVLAPSPSAFRDHLVIHPGSGDKKKNYSLPFWVKLMEELGKFYQRAPLHMKVLLGPAEAKQRPFFQELVCAQGWTISFTPSSDALLHLLRHTLLFIGHDSGITHLAAMAGAATIALFKASDPRLWRPLGPRVRLLQPEEDEKKFKAQVIREIEGFIASPHAAPSTT
ncbi:MAG: hypothetical protein DRG63_08535 [Deltaproteobacteria bacterium]|nr:MAG: hypothetical protein DRG63_08535 [Deltaproteobacteria bacterium]